MLSFLLPAVLIGLAVATISGPLGSFIVWRRMAYFGDAMAHGALLGIALALILDWPVTIMTFLLCISLALALVLLEHRKQLSYDTLLGILAHTTLALGLIMISLKGDRSINLHAYLFGNLLTITLPEAITLSGICLAIALLLKMLWPNMLNITLSEEIAYIEGTPVWLTKVALMVLIAILIAIGMRVMGIMLITSLLIIPAASARQHSSSPEQMAIQASAIGALAVVLGISLSYLINVPTGPAIVLCCGGIFILSLLLSKRQ